MTTFPHRQVAPAGISDATGPSVPPHDLSGLKRIDTFNTAEFRTRMAVLAFSFAALSYALMDLTLIGIYVGYLAMYSLYVTVLQAMPDRVDLWRLVVVGALSTITFCVMMLSAVYLFNMADFVPRFGGVALFFAGALYTVQVRAREPAVYSTDIAALFVTSGLLIWVQYDRAGGTASTIIMAAVMIAYFLYLLVTLREVNTFRRRLDANNEGHLAAEKQRAIGQLTSGVAHDFNNLLTVVLGNIELYRLADPNDKDRDQLLVEAEAAARRGAELTGQLLAFSRRSLLHPELVTVPEIIAGVGPLLSRLVGEKHSVSHIIAENLPRVRVDLGKIQSVMLNLVLNARDGMPDGGTIEVAAEQTQALDQPTLTLRVTDTGIGIPKHLLEDVFEPYFTTKPIGKGSGLGLSMAKGVVEQSGGRLDLRSRPGQGTVVEVHLPVVEAA